jgi:hypothetical protein
MSAIIFQRVEFPYMLGQRPEVLASGGVVWSNPCTEKVRALRKCPVAIFSERARMQGWSDKH